MRALICFFFLFFSGLVLANWEEGYRAFREDRWRKMTKPKPVQWPYPDPDTEFKIKQQWQQLSDERKFYWWWSATYSMAATKKDREYMNEYSSKYFHLGVLDNQAPGFEEFLKGKKAAQEWGVAKASPPPPATAPNRISATAPPPKPKPAPSPAKPKPQALADGSDSSAGLAPPPDIFRDRSDVTGGAHVGQDAFFDSTATGLGRYQQKLYLAIGSRWNNKIQQTMGKLGVDRVVIRFHVNPDGTISDLHFVQGNPNSILGLISADSIQQSGNLIGPFPADLLKEKPNGFPWQLAFRFY